MGKGFATSKAWAKGYLPTKKMAVTATRDVVVRDPDNIDKDLDDTIFMMSKTAEECGDLELFLTI